MLNFFEHYHHKILNHFDIQGLLYIPKEDDLKIWKSEIISAEIQQDRDLKFWA
jgi:hypothetical protein